jgi:hypothetical protein
MAGQMREETFADEAPWQLFSRFSRFFATTPPTNSSADR